MVSEDKLCTIVTNGTIKCKLLAIYNNGYLTSAGFFNDVTWIADEQINGVTYAKEGVLDLPVEWHDLPVNNGKYIEAVNVSRGVYYLDDGSETDTITFD